METYSLDLVFLGDLKARLAVTPRAYLGLKHWTVIEEDENRPLITSDCVTLDEVIWQTNRLKEELDTIVIKAKRQFDEYEKQQDEYLSTGTRYPVI